PELAAIQKMAEARENFWRQYVDKWKLTAVLPYAVAARPSAALIQQQEDQSRERSQAEVARLEQSYGVTNDQDAMRHYRDDYDAGTSILETTAKKDRVPRFAGNPPLGLDDTLDFKAATLPGDVPLTACNFENMTGATVGIALKLGGVSDQDLVFLSILP